MSKLYVLCGVPGSGKTTIAKQLEERGVKRHTYDDIPNARGNKDENGYFRNLWINSMRKDLIKGNDVVCDSTNLTIDFRCELLRAFYSIKCEKILILVDTPIAECILRNSKREYAVSEFSIIIANKLFQPPSYKEGWDKIQNGI